MVDIHCHIIPGVDDGAQNMDEALEIIRCEVEAGTSAFVCSPHVYEQVDLKKSAAFPDKVAELQRAVDSAEIQVALYSGAEVYPFSGALKGLDAGMPLTSANLGKHMLIDLPMGELPLDFDSLLFELLARGVTPIIAHPERNAVFQSEPDKLREYLDRQIACQINAGSVWGRYGDTAEDVAFYYLDRRWPHFLASDAHKPRDGGHIRRATTILEGRGIDSDYLHTITHVSGDCIAHGRPLPVIERIEPERVGANRPWYKRLLGG